MTPSNNPDPLTDAERDALRALAGQIADYCSYPRDVGAVYDALERDLGDRKLRGPANRVSATRFLEVLGVKLTPEQLDVLLGPVVQD